MRVKYFKQFFNFMQNEDMEVRVTSPLINKTYEVISLSEVDGVAEIVVSMEDRAIKNKPVGLHLFHKWSKWETIEHGGVKWKVIQERECTVCGKKQVKREKIKERKK